MCCYNMGVLKGTFLQLFKLRVKVAATHYGFICP